MAAKKKTDWDAVEPHYRCGIKSLRQIADEFGCTSGRVAQVAKERGWPRDLSAKIKAKAEAKLSKSILSAEVIAQRVISENEIVEANATMQVNALLGHRTDIKRHRTLSIKLLAEIEAQTNEPELFAQLGELLQSPDDKGIDRLNEIYRKVIATPSRIDSMKKLAETLKTLIALEREALGITGAEEDKPNKQDIPVLEAARRIAMALAAGMAQIEHKTS